MSDEDRLRDRFRARVSDVPIVTDLDDVASRIGSGRARRGRERPLVAVVVVTVVVGVCAGVALGRVGRGSSRTLTVAGSAAATDVTDTSAPEGFRSGAPVQGRTGSEDTPTTADASVHGISLGGEGTGIAGTTTDTGAESPGDANLQALETAWAQAFDGASPDQVKANAIVGGSGLVGVFHELHTGAYAQQIAGAKTVVDNVVFHSPTSATVFYHADLATGGISGPYTGDAILTPDGWKATHDSYCKVASLAGVVCI